MNTYLKLLSSVAVLALAACSSVPLPNANLEDARNSVNQAAVNPDVSRLAQSELARAREALNRADKAWSDNRDDAETAHLAYLANQRAHIAMNLAAQRAADQRVVDASAERERIRADVKTREAQLAQQRAQSAQLQAQSAQIQAQNAQAEAQNSQAQAQSGAEAVRTALIMKGVAANRIEVRGYGEARPIASNATAAGRQQNRRVEVVFSDARGQFAGLQ
jgi:hypothetical protein